MSKLPKISIITPNLNQGRFLAQAIKSVLAQDYPNFELFVIDAGSTDESLEVIKKYQQHLTGWVSEPDKGQSDAINKGLRMATGELVTWLNADDFFVPGAFHQVAKAFEDPNVKLISGYYESFSDKGERYRNLRMLKFKGLEETIFFGMISTPAMFYRKSLYAELGYLNTELHYFFDLEFYYRFLLKYGLSNFKLIDGNLTIFRLHKGSKTVSLKDRFRTEAYHLHHTLIESLNPVPALHPAFELPLRRMELQLQWNANQLNPRKMAAYFAERTLERMHRDFSFFRFFQTYFWSLRKMPFGRRWRFYTIPLRKVLWHIKGI